MTRPSGDCRRWTCENSCVVHRQGWRQGPTSYVPGRTNASFPKYLQMSDVMTSRSIPSRGTKYSFWRGTAGGIACVGLLLGLPVIVESLFRAACGVTTEWQREDRDRKESRAPGKRQRNPERMLGGRLRYRPAGLGKDGFPGQKSQRKRGGEFRTREGRRGGQNEVARAGEMDGAWGPHWA